MTGERGPKRSALIVAVPEAEPVVAGLRQAHDPSAKLGVPAHVTVLFPFVPAADVDRNLATLRELFVGVPSFGYRFDRVERFGDTTVFLAPEPRSAFSNLTEQVAARWPEHPPYEGVFEVVIPHLTVGDELDAQSASRVEDLARAALSEHGPITGRASEVALIVEGDDDHWSSHSRLPLGHTRP
jgi:hypothetical protein